MNEYISPQRAEELIKIKQSRNRKKLPAVELPEKVYTDLHVLHSRELGGWLVKDGGTVLEVWDTEQLARSSRERLEDERA